jgi:hypothetical protein
LTTRDKLAIELVRNSRYATAMPEAALAMQALQFADLT